MLTHLSLFSGIGGIDLAAHWAGFKTVAFCEQNEFCQKVLRKNFGQDIEIFDDVRTLTAESLRARGISESTSLVSGGFPCQPFSTAGRRAGSADNRHLWPQMLRVIKELKPAWVCGENVAGILSMAEPIGKAQVESRTVTRDEGSDLFTSILTQQEAMLVERICQDLEKAGYEVQPLAIPACAAGAFHRRDRVWITAYSHSSWQSQQEGRERQQRQRPERCGEDAADASRGRLRCGRGCQPLSPARCQGDVSDSYGQLKRVITQAMHAGQSESSGRGDVEHADRAGLESVGRRAEGDRPIEGRNSADLGYEATQSGANVRHAAGERLPDWSGGEVGQPFPLTEFERPSGREVERNFRGMAHGIPRRVDRLRALGNAVVPQQVYPILKAIADYERARINQTAP
jgi:DNA (cytosine-5)-methyltransferase 1